jgi:hypothetical protein
MLVLLVLLSLGVDSQVPLLDLGFEGVHHAHWLFRGCRLGRLRGLPRRWHCCWLLGIWNSSVFLCHCSLQSFHVVRVLNLFQEGR